MANPIKTWFFELIEDAIGSKAMKQFNEEEEERKKKKIQKTKQKEFQTYWDAKKCKTESQFDRSLENFYAAEHLILDHMASIE